METEFSLCHECETGLAHVLRAAPSVRETFARALRIAFCKRVHSDPGARPVTGRTRGTFRATGKAPGSFA